MSLCLFVHLFDGHFETDLDAFWHKVYFCSLEVSKTVFEKIKKPAIGDQKLTEIWSEFQGITKWGELVSDISPMLKVHYVSPLYAAPYFFLGSFIYLT